MGPPRLLLGAALLFWGGMTDRALAGLACALLVEGAHWTRIRWDFQERAFLLAWRLSVFFLLVAMVLVVLDGARLHAMARVFTWLPVVLMPLQFVQSYGMSRTMTMATFSLLVRRRRDHALRYGLPFKEVRFGFGHVFLGATLLASCLGSQAGSAAFFPGLILLVSWALVAAAGRGWRGLGLATLVALICAALAGIGGQVGLSALYRYLTSGRWAYDGDPGLNQARERQTSIGSLGRIKQSHEIKWRLIPEQGPLPRLLRVASYSNYYSTHWQVNLLPENVATFKDDFQSPQTLINPANPTDPDDSFVIAPPDLADLNAAIDPALPRFRLRGAVPKQGTLMPLPADAASLHRFAFEDLERSSFGTFRLTPSQPVADARVLWREDFATERPPWTSIDYKGVRKPAPGEKPPEPGNRVRRVRVRPDLQIPPREQEMLRQEVDAIGMRHGSLRERIALLQRHFIGNFRYTRYNAVPRDLRDRENGTLLGTFLQKTRAGHCEYFATATALLLRETGVPTRYVSGFAVAEIDRDSGEALVRGTHAHAWCRAWDEAAGSWLDVDLTPPDWTGLETPRASRFQALSDRFQLLREDLLVWRDQPGNMTLVTAVLLGPILVGLVFIGRNLWRSRSRLDPVRALARGAATVPATPLRALEKPARRLLGERPPGTPLARWLMRLAPELPRPALLAEALDLHHRLRFDPAARDPALVAELEARVTALRGDLAKHRRPANAGFPRPPEVLG